MIYHQNGCGINLIKRVSYYKYAACALPLYLKDKHVLLMELTD